MLLCACHGSEILEESYTWHFTHHDVLQTSTPAARQFSEITMPIQDKHVELAGVKKDSTTWHVASIESTK